MAERVFYCPTHGRVTEDRLLKFDVEDLYDPPYVVVYVSTLKGEHEECRHCEQWALSKSRFKAKKAGES